MRSLIVVFLCCITQLLSAQRVDNDVRSVIKQLSEGPHATFPPRTTLVSATIHQQALTIQLDIDREWLTDILDENIHEAITEELAGAIDLPNVIQINVMAKNRFGKWMPLSSFLPVVPYQTSAPMTNAESVRAVKGDLTKKTILLDGQAQPKGILSGKTVWLSAGHGWQYDNRRKTFRTQRHNHHGIVEDLAAVEAINYHLIKYLWNAGANVWTVRERDMNTNEIIIDNDDPNHYRETGDWSLSRGKGFENRSYRYTITKPEETASATFFTDIKSPGKYWVSVYYVAGTNRTVDARYRIEHAGGTSVVSVNQEVHGNTWVYLGQFYFDNYAAITITNESSERNQALIADAVRLGGGLGNVPDCFFGKPSGEPRYEEASKYYAAYQGFPHCTNDVMTRPQYAEWELSKGTAQEKQNAIYVSWHSNANGSGGTETYIHSYNAQRGSRSLQHHIHEALIEDLQNTWDDDWIDRGKKRADFGELRGLQTMPGVLLEMAFHDHREDAKALSDPRFREVAAKAVYKGIVNYFSEKDRVKSQFLPEKPMVVWAKGQSDGSVELNWDVPKYGRGNGDRATAYRVFHGQHGKGFSGGIYTKTNKYIFKNLKKGVTYFFRVSAVNDGGESMPSSVVAVRLPESDKQLTYLIVDGYDRMDRTLALNENIPKPAYAPLGKTKRLYLERMNNFDYAVEHARALERFDIAFDGATNEALTEHALKIKIHNYDGVNWFVGKESEKDLTLSRAEQQVLEKYLQGGGKLIISGSELAYHLDRKSGGRRFFRNYLKARYQKDNAGSQQFYSKLSYLTLRGSFLPMESDDYPVSSPDAILPVNGGQAILTYQNDGVAAVGYKGAYGVIYSAIPFEAIRSGKKREEIMKGWLRFLHGKGVLREKPLVAR